MGILWIEGLELGAESDEVESDGQGSVGQGLAKEGSDFAFHGLFGVGIGIGDGEGER